jgi:hypothetical protein
MPTVVVVTPTPRSREKKKRRNRLGESDRGQQFEEKEVSFVKKKTPYGGPIRII